MKILIVSHACTLPQNQKLFALAAEENHWEVTLVLPQFWKNEYGQVRESTLMDGFNARLVCLPVLFNGSVPLHAYRARASRLLKRINPDVVYSHNEPYGLSTLQWCFANAHSIQKPFGFFSCQNLVKRYPLPFRQSEAWVYRQSSFAFPITGAVDSVHRQKGYAGPSVVLPLGYDPSMYYPASDIGARHKRSSGPVRLAFVGRVVEEKGLLTLCRALGKLRHLDWELMLVGSGPFEPQVRNELHAQSIADRVQWLGFMPHADVARFFESIDVLVLPSESRPNWKEQFGRVLIESMACGTPVIGSDSGEIPTIIEQTGGGLVFRENDPQDCAFSLERMIDSRELRAAMGQEGYEFVSSHYALPKLAHKFADAILCAAQ